MLTERANALEKAFGMRFDQVGVRCTDLSTQLSSLATTQERLVGVEKTLGDLVLAHEEGLAGTRLQLDQTQVRLSACESLQNRLSACNDSLENRCSAFESLQKRFPMHEAHCSSFELSTKDMLEQIQGRLSACEKHYTSFEGSVDLKLDSFHTSLKSCSDSLELKFESSVSSVDVKLEKIHSRLSACERRGGTMDQRVESIQVALSRAVDPADLAKRFGGIDRACSDLAERLDREWATARSKLEQLHGLFLEVRTAREENAVLLTDQLTKEKDERLTSIARVEKHLGSLEKHLGNCPERQDKLAEELQALDSKLDSVKTASNTGATHERLKYFETILHDGLHELARKLDSEIETLRPRLEQLWSRVDEHHSKSRERSMQLEEGLAAAHLKLEQMLSRISSCELLKNSVDMKLESLQSSIANSLNAKLDQMQSRLSAFEDQQGAIKSSVEIRLASFQGAMNHSLDAKLDKRFEKVLGDVAAKYDDDLRALQGKLDKLQGLIPEECTARERDIARMDARISSLALVEEHLAALQRAFAESSGRSEQELRILSEQYSREMAMLRQRLNGLGSQVEEHNSQLTHVAAYRERIASLEKTLSNWTNFQEELASSRSQIEQLRSRLASLDASLESSSSAAALIERMQTRLSACEARGVSIENSLHAKLDSCQSLIKSSVDAVDVKCQSLVKSSVDAWDVKFDSCQTFIKTSIDSLDLRLGEVRERWSGLDAAFGDLKVKLEELVQAQGKDSGAVALLEASLAKVEMLCARQGEELRRHAEEMVRLGTELSLAADAERSFAVSSRSRAMELEQRLREEIRIMDTQGNPEQGRLLRELTDRLDCVQARVSGDFAVLNQIKDDQDRIWDAIGSHTHDLSSKVKQSYVKAPTMIQNAALSPYTLGVGVQQTPVLELVQSPTLLSPQTTVGSVTGSPTSAAPSSPWPWSSTRNRGASPSPVHQRVASVSPARTTVVSAKRDWRAQTEQEITCGQVRFAEESQRSVAERR